MSNRLKNSGRERTGSEKILAEKTGTEKMDTEKSCVNHLFKADSCLREMSPLLKCFLMSVLFLCLVFYPAFSQAEFIQPGEVQIKTASYVPQHINFPLGTYYYKVNWQGIPVGKASIEVGAEGVMPEVKVSAKAETARVIRIFYSLDHYSESIFDAHNLTPSRFFTTQTVNSKTKSRTVSFNSGKVNSVIRRAGQIEPDEVLDFSTDNAVFDPISASFLARSMPVTIGEKLSFDVFNGKHRFLITLEVMGKESIRLAGLEREAFKVVPTIRKLTDTEGEKNFRSATIWISADENRDVLKISSNVLIGSVNAELERFVPAVTPFLQQALLNGNKPPAEARAALKQQLP